VDKTTETVSAQLAPKLSIRGRKGESPLLRASRQSLTAGKSRIEIALERRRLGALDQDQIIVLTL
jgi:hypothetical protein